MDKDSKAAKKLTKRPITMSTLELAGLTGLDHLQVVDNTRLLLDVLGTNAAPFYEIEIHESGITLLGYRMPRFLITALVANYGLMRDDHIYESLESFFKK